MTGFAGPFHVLTAYDDVTVASVDINGVASFAGVAVSGTAQHSSFLFQGTKNVSFTATALNSTQSTGFSTSKQPYVLLCMTIGGTTVAFPGYPAGSYAG